MKTKKPRYHRSVKNLKNFKNAAWKESVTKVIQQIQEQDIKFVRLQFTDINGFLKNLSVSSKNLEAMFDNGQPFDHIRCF